MNRNKQRQKNKKRSSFEKICRAQLKKINNDRNRSVLFISVYFYITFLCTYKSCVNISTIRFEIVSTYFEFVVLFFGWIVAALFWIRCSAFEDCIFYLRWWQAAESEVAGPRNLCTVKMMKFNETEMHRSKQTP